MPVSSSSDTSDTKASTKADSTKSDSTKDAPKATPATKDYPLSAEDRIDRQRKDNPQLEHVLDALQVARDNLPVADEKLVAALENAEAAVREAFVSPSEKEIAEQAEAEEAAKQPL